MADLGAIGRSSGGFKALGVPLYGGYISGTVYDGNGNPTKHLVRAHHRQTGELNGGTYSDATTGTYTIRIGIKYGQTQHYVIETDPALAYTPRIHDGVTPLL